MRIRPGFDPIVAIIAIFGNSIGHSRTFSLRFTRPVRCYDLSKIGTDGTDYICLK